jgi:DNA-binding transcriptional ArsR family regulator
VSLASDQGDASRGGIRPHLVFNESADNRFLVAVRSSTMRLKTNADEPQLSMVFTALGDSTRRDLVARLAGRDATVGELAEPYEMSIQAISKHLKVLEDAGLVTKTKHGQRRSVHLESNVFDLMTRWIERYQREAEQRFQRLDAVLAELDPANTDTDTNHKTKRSAS